MPDDEGRRTIEERITSAQKLPGDEGFEESLRPSFLSEYIGQARAKENLGVYIEAARMRKEPMDHVLLSGPPGLGKTTLAHVIANELGVGIRVTSGPAIERAGDLVAILTSLEDRDILFIDEIHRLNKTCEEALYPAMEDFVFDWVSGKGPSARTYRIKIPRFTLVGATTRQGLLTSPLRDRFGINLRLEYYSSDELLQVVLRSSRILKIPVDEEGAREIASRSRGSPRVANRLLKRVRDYAEVRKDGKIAKEVAGEALDLLEIDEAGLDKLDQEILRTIAYKYGGGPVGLSTLAAALSEDPETIEYVYEPYLLQKGFLERTARGRVITPFGLKHLGSSPAEPSQGRLFPQA